MNAAVVRVWEREEVEVDEEWGQRRSCTKRARRREQL